MASQAQRKIDGQFRSYKALANHFVDTLRGLETLKTLGQSKTHEGSILRVSQRYRKATMSTLRMAFLSSFALDFFTMLSVASVAVGLGLRLTEGHMLLGPALTVLILAPEYFLPVRMLGADYHATLDGKEAGAAINQVIERGKAAEQKQKEAYANVVAHADMAEDGTGSASSLSLGKRKVATSTIRVVLNDKTAAGHLAPASVSASVSTTPELVSSSVFSWNEHSRLALTDVQVRHDDEGPYSLKDVTFQITGLGKIGIIGTSGAGKSTLIDVLAGFQLPTSGQVLANGQPVSQDMLESWRRQTAAIPQHPYIFSGSLADNVRFYMPEASDAEVAKAISAGGLTKLLSSLSGGLYEPIGAGGEQAQWWAGATRGAGKGLA